MTPDERNYLIASLAAGVAAKVVFKRGLLFSAAVVVAARLVIYFNSPLQRALAVEHYNTA